MERDNLLHWLDRAAARARAGVWLREAGKLILALAALLALHQSLRSAISEPEVLAALLPFFVLAAAGAAVVFILRLLRPATRMQAAAATDARAGLKDELRSALWFTQDQSGGPLVELLLARASHRVRTLDARGLFPLTLPRSMLVALLLVLLAVALPWLFPGTSRPAGAPNPVSQVATTPAARPQHPQENRPQATSDQASVPISERSRAIWSQIQELASTLTGDAEEQAIGRALATRDATRAAQLLQTLQARRAARAAAGRAARPETEQMSAALAEGILDRIKALLKEEAAQSNRTGPDQPDAPTAQLTERLRADAQVEKSDARGQQSAGEEALNAMLRAINRSGIGRRDALGGGGEAAEAGSRSSAGGGAMGRRVGVSRAGAGDGEQPQANPAGGAEAEPVIGKKTLRLEAQLQRVKVESTPDEDQPGSEEALYAATRAQEAKLGYQDVVANARQSAEVAVSGERVPLAYRDAVKRYTLEQHDKERPGAAGDSARTDGND